MARARSLPPKLSRRTFIQRLTFFGGGVVLLGGAACKRSKEAEAPKPAEPTGTTAAGQTLRTFSAFEYAVVAAATERLLPRDEDPGAQDADVALYIDHILETQGLESMHRDFLQGLSALERRAQRMFQKGFAQATPAQQDELLAIFKDSPAGSGEAHFFELLMTLSLEGFLGDPSYGGNKGRVGWRLMGFDTVGTLAMAPPEGYDGPRCLRECGGHHP
ncbi:gluconate 2-dehydrogenase subunit 3 family protein [Corallococcus sp. AB049A]|uniref:Gluconate 2-dehydrogenase subunit 3 family protein n=1 Tax=Corallococcus interemptor TaxID=2316720 RepID=A0A3A8QPD6_9BACT|nr:MULTISPECIES: gluconate 2-dehydrogenase subunit 3 family protein [Corallococcus]RKH49105.1 gluconate 2-dehydrogenase subunit 3 family protein [Corallococcus sp. AB050B]RKH70606.1 gluconate 2-dehydrogenase subunit 3 family protein [Corallococcus interemptor]RKI62925.1 gluconate 2-dehydrogenase subunit 3 family protein [Corallococcus sp. AB049A]